MSKQLINFRAEDGKGAFPNETTFLSSVHSFLTSTTTVPYPPVIGPTVLFADVSTWQGDIDFATMKERIDFVVIKSNQGLWVDNKFEENVQGALDAGLLVGFYEFIDPAQVGAKKAAEFHYNLTKNIGGIVSWMDCERNGGLGQSALLTYYKDYYSTLTGLLNGTRKIEVYSRMSFWRDAVARSNFWRDNNVQLNAARYHLGLKSPWSDGYYPAIDWSYGINEFAEWQYSADGNGLGAYFGCQSNSIDLNLFYGDLTAFKQCYGLLGDPQPEPIPLPEDNNTWVFKTIANVSRRTQPIVNASTYVDTLPTGYSINAKSIVNPNYANFWLEFDTNNSTYYTALVYNGKQYCKPI